MATTKETCKVCGSLVESAICHHCGWTPVLFPASVPKAINDFETERLNVAKETIRKKEELDKISSQLSKAQVILKKKEEELKTVETEAQTNKQKITKLEKDLAHALEEAGKSNLSDLKGIVIISDMTDVAVSGVSANISTPVYRQCLPVLTGINTYGTDRSDGLHHQITIHCRGEVFLPVHFSVDTNHSRGLVVKDLSNGRITLNGNSFKEEYAGSSQFFIKQGRQLFTIEIKSLTL